MHALIKTSTNTSERRARCSHYIFSIILNERLNTQIGCGKVNLIPYKLLLLLLLLLEVYLQLGERVVCGKAEGAVVLVQRGRLSTAPFQRLLQS